MTDRVITVKIRGEIAGFKRAMTDARQETAKTAAQFDRDGKKIESTSGRQVRSAEVNRQAWTTAGTAMVAFGAAGVLAIGYAAKAAIEWETAWTGVLKTVDGTAEQMSNLESQLREMTKTLPVTHAQVAAVAEAAG
uniref:phage tail tape measure protein n=1 Tax=Stenotrophomonas maltophilia TaxID=40324 RepID=UPI003BF7EECF